MSTHDNGGPAFPGVEKLLTSMGEIDLPRQGGITLRDYFAAKAMPALYAAALNDSVKESGVFSVPEWRYDSIARESYELADAMLKARGGAQ